MTGDYSTVQDVYGDITFEVNMKVHHNHLPQYDGWVYMVWLQAIDPAKSTEDDPWYEGFSCSIRYDDSIGSAIRSNFLFRQGYLGI